MPDGVGYLGPGTISWGRLAAEKYFSGKTVDFFDKKSHSEICLSVAEEELPFGVVAIENVLDGIVIETVRAMKDRHNDGLRIIGETELLIRHYLFRNPKDDTIPKIVVSHPSAIGQCIRIRSQLEKIGITTQAVGSTAAAAKLASENPDYLAICSKKAEKEFGLIRTMQIGQSALKNPRSKPEVDITNDDHIGDNDCNFTRFWVIGTRKTTPTGKDKTCFLVGLDQKAPGALSKVFRCFADRGRNLLIVLPVPIRGRKWEYNFLLEYEGHIRDPLMQEAYEELKDSGTCVDEPLVLGSYPTGSYPGIPIY